MLTCQHCGKPYSGFGIRPPVTCRDCKNQGREDVGASSGYIETVPARDLRVGDVFSTDGYRVTWVCLLSGGAPDEVSVVVSKAGHEKTAYLAPDFLCHLWRERVPA